MKNKKIISPKEKHINILVILLVFSYVIIPNSSSGSFVFCRTFFMKFQANYSFKCLTLIKEGFINGAIFSLQMFQYVSITPTGEKNSTRLCAVVDTGL